MKIGILLAILLICAGCSELGEMQTTRARINTFDAGRESWQIYDYTGGSGNQNVFYLTSWEERGGVGRFRVHLGRRPPAGGSTLLKTLTRSCL